MALNIEVKTGVGKFTVILSGQFDFGSHRDFREACGSCLKAEGVKEIEVDLAGVDYIDSSALGMLLLLKEKASVEDKKVYLINVQGNVQRTLEIANFDKYFAVRT